MRVARRLRVSTFMLATAAAIALPTPPADADDVTEAVVVVDRLAQGRASDDVGRWYSGTFDDFCTILTLLRFVYSKAGNSFLLAL